MLTSVEQKNILELLGSKDSLFLIPDYQRPYAWGDDECSALWDDIVDFAVTGNSFNINNEYFLGPIVTFRNESKKLEVIDGQQRLITILLMLRAFYQDMDNFSDSWSREIRKNIGRCIWETDEEGRPDRDKLKIDSQVVTDDERNELAEILRSGNADNMKSRYAANYRLLQGFIRSRSDRHDKSSTDFQHDYSKLPNRILNNCILLPIQANTQDAALRIFSTLNDRGKPLSDSDIFKVKLYKAFSDDGRKDYFTDRWKELETLCGRIFSPLKISCPMDELFNRYMHYERAKAGITDSTQEGLRSFYERGNYRLLREEHERVFANLQALAGFWRAVADQDEGIFSEQVLRRLFVLDYAPNAAWTLITSVYFMSNKDAEGRLDDAKFYDFLGKITAFIWTATILGANSHNLRTPLFREMVEILGGHGVTFGKYRFDAEELKAEIQRCKFNGKKKITRSMLAWWLMADKEQPLLLLSASLETEHIAKKGKINPDMYEMLGNKSLLEGKIKSSAANLDFTDKKRYYIGIPSLRKAGTQIHELHCIAGAKGNFNAKDISQRSKKIIEGFLQFVAYNGLTK